MSPGRSIVGVTKPPVQPRASPGSTEAAFRLDNAVGG